MPRDVGPEHRRLTVHAGAEFEATGGAIRRRASELRIHRRAFPHDARREVETDTTTARSRGDDARWTSREDGSLPRGELCAYSTLVVVTAAGFEKTSDK